MARFRDIKTLQKFTSVHASIHNHFTRISDFAVVPYGQDTSARLDFRGSDARNPATEGDTLWVNYSTRRFSSRSMAF